MKYLAIIPLIIMSSFMALHHFYLVPMMVPTEEAMEAEALDLLKGPFSETAEGVEGRAARGEGRGGVVERAARDSAGGARREGGGG